MVRASNPRRPSSDPALVWLLAALPKGRGAMPPAPPPPPASRAPAPAPRGKPPPKPMTPPDAPWLRDARKASTSCDDPRSSVGGGGGGSPPLDDSVLMILRCPPVEAMNCELEYPPPERAYTSDDNDEGETSKMSGEAARLSAEEQLPMLVGTVPWLPGWWPVPPEAAEGRRSPNPREQAAEPPPPVVMEVWSPDAVLFEPLPPRRPPPPPAALPASDREYAPAERFDGLPVGVGVMVPPALPQLAWRLAVLTLRALPRSPS